MQREADLIEEVARIHGLDKLPTTLPARQQRDRAADADSQRLRRRLEDVLRDRGLHEAIAYSFTSPEALARLRLDDEPLLTLENPLSEDQSVMRPLLLPGLLDAARAQRRPRPAPACALFESAHVYAPERSRWTAPDGIARAARTPARERHHLGGRC